jgi:predicted enzyme related to lactoylglutathione lyase
MGIFSKKGAHVGKVTGLGGVFFKADDPKRLSSWYETHLGLKGEDGSVLFRWRERDADAPGMTVWSIFPRDSGYFDPSRSPFMLNYRVDDLDAILERLRAEGVTIDERREDSQYGRFAWIMDPEGNRIELWQPPAES